MPASGAILRLLPRWSRPVLAPFITAPNHWYARKYIALVRPEIVRRQELSRDKGAAKPNDMLQWLVDHAEASPLPYERKPRTIALRLLLTNFAAIHTSSFTITNVMFDIVAAGTSVMGQLREEAHTALIANNGKWDKALVNQLVKLDSSMRESLRCGTFVTLGVGRKVIAPNGITAPNGTWCPRGSTVSVPTAGIHNDPENYSEPDKFQPLRFAQMREPVTKPPAQSPDQQGTKDNSRLIKNAALSFVSLSSTYHPFGYGRHACPGRFFASNELKLMLAHVFENYEIEPLEVRPPYTRLGATLLPPMKATIKVRKIRPQGLAQM
jgi:cytochrome P450